MIDWTVFWNKARKVIYGGLIAAGGAFLTYVLQWLSGVDLGFWGPTVTAIISLLIQALRKAGEYVNETLP